MIFNKYQTKELYIKMSKRMVKDSFFNWGLIISLLPGSKRRKSVKCELNNIAAGENKPKTINISSDVFDSFSLNTSFR